ncbi:hypothetical protein [Virgibacillus senegalensis]|uniref:hypothetical protein n=1 Tax=Virgibacillus senegalensis TaxID=1499679 RepID=UPI00069E992B|nr:hypothetical protein [Virgibacillus senegalensis]
MNKKWDDQRVEKNLRKMPTIQDSRSEEELYQKVVAGLQDSDRKQKRSWKSWMIPSFATLAVLVLIAVISQSAIRMDRYSDPEDAVDSYTNEMADESKSANSVEERLQPERHSADEQNGAADGEVNVTMAEEPISKAVYIENKETTVFDVSIPIDGSGYLIPTSYVTKNTNQSMEDQLNHFVDTSEIGLPANLLEGATFQVDKSDGAAIVNFPEDYSFEDERFTGNLGVVLSRLFLPHKINQVKLKRNGKTGIPVETKGEVVDKIPLKEPGNYVYKLYQPQDDAPEFLAAVPVTIKEDMEAAFLEMRKEEPDYNLKAAIPEDVKFQVQTMDENVLVDLNGAIGNNQKTLDMMEAMMMTAKSFGYKRIEFNTGMNRVGPYDQLDKPLKVPDGIHLQ